MTPTHEERLSAASLSLEGLSVGDAVGRERLSEFTRPWQYSDDTVMAMSILEVLAAHRAIDQDALAAAFARRFERDPERGYGAAAYWLLSQLTMQRDWRLVSREVFSGQGSLGNGAAMRVAPLGAYFADDMPRVAREAELSAAVTHAHPDGQAGAIAVAVAAACAHAHHRSGSGTPAPPTLFDLVLQHTPPGATRDGIAAAAALGPSDAAAAAVTLGDGSQVRSSDTVPFALWCAAHHLDDYEGAIRAALAGCERPAADRDTICAIVGSIVVLSSGLDGIPPAWRHAREPLEP